MSKLLRSPMFVVGVVLVAVVVGCLGYQRWVVWPRQEAAIGIARVLGGFEESPPERPEWINSLGLEFLADYLPKRGKYYVRYGRYIEDEEAIASIADLPDLYSVAFESRHITDRTLQRLSRFNGIGHLELIGCEVTDAGLKSLCPLHLYSLELVGTRATHVGLFHFDLRDTYSLTVDFRLLANATSEERKRLSSLTSLTLMDDATPSVERRWDFLDDFPQLNSLRIYVLLDDRAAKEIARLPVLGELNAKVVDDRHIELLGASPALKTLQLFGNFTGAGFKGFAGNGVEKVELHSDALEDAMLGELQRLPALSDLVIVSPRITRSGMTQLSKCANILHLELQGAQIGEEDLDVFRQFPQLRKLTLRATKVTYEAALRNVKKFPFEFDWWPRARE